MRGAYDAVSQCGSFPGALWLQSVLCEELGDVRAAVGPLLKQYRETPEDVKVGLRLFALLSRVGGRSASAATIAGSIAAACAKARSPAPVPEHDRLLLAVLSGKREAALGALPSAVAAIRARRDAFAGSERLSREKGSESNLAASSSLADAEWSELGKGLVASARIPGWELLVDKASLAELSAVSVPGMFRLARSVVIRGSGSGANQPPAELQALEKELAEYSPGRPCRLWFVKDAKRQRGEGVSIVRSLAEVGALANVPGRTYVVQQSIPNPLLLEGGRKFEMRFYALAWSLTRAAVFTDSLLSRCGDSYTEDDASAARHSTNPHMLRKAAAAAGTTYSYDRTKTQSLGSAACPGFDAVVAKVVEGLRSAFRIAQDRLPKNSESPGAQSQEKEQGSPWAVAPAPMLLALDVIVDTAGQGIAMEATTCIYLCIYI